MDEEREEGEEEKRAHDLLDKSHDGICCSCVLEISSRNLAIGFVALAGVLEGCDW